MAQVAQLGASTVARHVLQPSEEATLMYNRRQLGSYEEQTGMSTQSRDEVTQLLHAWRAGEESALRRLIPLVHAELQRLAHNYLRMERQGHTLQTGALVNEAYLRLVDARQMELNDRAHFIAFFANLMRQVLVQHARMRAAQKRGGGGTVRVYLNEDSLPTSQRDVNLVALDDALVDLEHADAREVRIVELRFFGGLNEREIGETLGISERTVRREWEHAKAWLFKRVKS
jgi:RNA polymerase sigma factor (TIGR02999 family)